MTQSWNNTGFKKSCLASVITILLSPSVYALESLSDNNLSETTGEGIALLPENFKMVFQKTNDTSTPSSYHNNAIAIADRPKYDTGFIRIIPTGENYELLYQRTYDQIYKQSTSDNYQTIYDQNYQSQYNSNYQTIYNNYYANGSVNGELYQAVYAELYAQNKDRFTSAKINEYYNTTTYKNFYNSRNSAYKNEYYWKDGWLYTRRYTDEQAAQMAMGDTVDKIKTEQGSNINTYVDQQVALITTPEVQKRAETMAKNEATVLAQQYVNNAVKQKATTDANNDTETTLRNLRNKADVFIYGLALSKSNGNLNQRYSNVGLNWGSAANPWLFRASTAENIQQFSAANMGDIGYLALEAPLAKDGGDAASDRIKLGFWTDIFSRSFDSNRTINAATGAPDSGLDKDYRLRSQFVANGLSINGSQLRLFQTQKDTVNKIYNETLGIAALLRINTNDNPSTLKFSDANLDEKGIRISTAAKTNTDDGSAVTPAMDSSLAPLFNENDGLYLYSTNINLVLGNMYQPFILASEGNNIILEVTRIPKVPTIYSKIYTLYTDTDPNPQFESGTGLTKESFKGSTCNVSYCGTNFSDITTGSNTVKYQGTNATHSSIAIGSVTRDPTTNLLKANRDGDSTGIVFKNPAGVSTNLGSAVIDGVLIQHLKFKTTGL